VAVSRLHPQLAQLNELIERFKKENEKFALVGGALRDSIIGRETTDLDFTTSAKPELIKKLLKGWADAVWEIGADFGTITAKKNELNIEITTYRNDVYRSESRKPQISFSEKIEEDLIRRDFTINAIALELTGTQPELIDPFDGVMDIAKRIIKTPTKPELSFEEDPLRILRAIRFATQLEFEIEPTTLNAVVEMRDRLEIISKERIRDEFNKIILANQPRIGLQLLVETKVAEKFIPEIPLLRLEIDEHHHHKDVYEHTLKVVEQAISLESRIGEKDLILRLAALFHDIGKPNTRELLPGGGVAFHHHEVVGARMVKQRLKELKYSSDIINSVGELVFLHLRFHGYGNGEWSDSAVRRYVRDAGDNLIRLHLLTRADCTTRNQRKAETLALNYDSLEKRIAQLMEEEELSKIRPELDGQEIMEILQLKPSKTVGAAYDYLMEIRLEKGLIGKEEAIKLLKDWWLKEGQNISS
jgi:poly(A) polymerase